MIAAAGHRGLIVNLNIDELGRDRTNRTPGALAYTKAARDVVEFVRRRIVDMAGPDANPACETIPIRSLDQAGALTAAFNVLVDRFAGTTVFNSKLFGFTALVCILAWTTSQAITSARQKMMYVEPDGKR